MISSTYGVKLQRKIVDKISNVIGSDMYYLLPG